MPSETQSSWSLCDGPAQENSHLTSDRPTAIIASSHDGRPHLLQESWWLNSATYLTPTCHMLSLRVVTSQLLQIIPTLIEQDPSNVIYTLCPPIYLISVHTHVFMPPWHHETIQWQSSNKIFQQESSA